MKHYHTLLCVNSSKQGVPTQGEKKMLVFLDRDFVHNPIETYHVF